MVIEGRQKLDQGVAEARDPVGGEVLEDTQIDQHADDGLASPVVGAAQDACLQDPQAGLWLERAVATDSAGP